MTTEAEEFERQHERFNELSNRFQRLFGTYEKPRFSIGPIHYPNGCSEDLVYSFWINDGSHSVNLFLGDYTRHKNLSESLRALNDRLELALQGKVKGE